jgi:hypothetical protein
LYVSSFYCRRCFLHWSSILTVYVPDSVSTLTSRERRPNFPPARKSRWPRPGLSRDYNCRSLTPSQERRVRAPGHTRARVYASPYCAWFFSHVPQQKCAGLILPLFSISLSAKVSSICCHGSCFPAEEVSTRERMPDFGFSDAPRVAERPARLPVRSHLVHSHRPS